MERLIEFSTNHWYYTLALAATLGMLTYSFVAPRFRKFKAVSPIEATGLINRQDAVVLDIRDSHEYNSGHIVDSIHIPLAKLPTRLKELESHKSKPIIVMCRTGTRTTPACNSLVKNGFEQVYSLHGGLVEWEAANLPVSRSSKPKKKRKGDKGE